MSKVEVRDPEFPVGGDKGKSKLSVDHPGIKRGIENAKKSGLNKEQIAKVIGVPVEVVERHSR